jgi:hypothetical protein
VLLALLLACSPSARPTSEVRAPEQPVLRLALDPSSPVADAGAEISGMAWFGDALVLLPQYPSRHLGGDRTRGELFVLEEAAILARLGGDPGPLTPRPVPFAASGEVAFPGFEGYEAIAFSGASPASSSGDGRALLTVETSDGGLLCPASFSLEAGLRYDPAACAPVPNRSGVRNMAEESLVISGERALTLHELNAPDRNPRPVAHAFGLDGAPAATLDFPPIAYRVTDATAVDAQGRFWVINYYYPGTRALYVEEDPLVATWGQGATHARSRHVERLLELEWGEGGVTLVERPPIQLELAALPRNWEGLARLGDRGFLLVTDEHPAEEGTILAFVPATTAGN